MKRNVSLVLLVQRSSAFHFTLTKIATPLLKTNTALSLSTFITLAYLTLEDKKIKKAKGVPLLICCAT